MSLAYLTKQVYLMPHVILVVYVEANIKRLFETHYIHVYILLIKIWTDIDIFTDIATIGKYNVLYENRQLSIYAEIDLWEGEFF